VPIDPAALKALADAGGFALFLLIVVVAAVGLWRQWWVPGWLWKQERSQRITAEIQAVRNGEALEKLARAVTGEHAPRRRPPEKPLAHDPD
jgi:hypothetical protein